MGRTWWLRQYCADGSLAKLDAWIPLGHQLPRPQEGHVSDCMPPLWRERLHAMFVPPQRMDRSSGSLRKTWLKRGQGVDCLEGWTGGGEDWKERVRTARRKPSLKLKAYGEGWVQVNAETLSHGSHSVMATVLVQCKAPQTLLLGTDLMGALHCKNYCVTVVWLHHFKGLTQ